MSVAEQTLASVTAVARSYEIRRLLWRTTLIQFALSAVLAFALVKEVAPNGVFAWMAMLWLALGLRGVALAAAGRDGSLSANWEWVVEIGAAVVGGCWGAAAFLFIGHSGLSIAETSLFYVLAGVAAAGGTMYAGQPRAAVAFILASLLPVVAAHLFSGGGDHILLAAATTLYTLTLLAVARHLRALAQGEFLARAENAQLAARVEQEASRRLVELEQAQARASRQEAMLAGFVANVPGVLFSIQVGVNGRPALRFVSEGLWELFGLLPEEADLPRLVAMVHPDDLAALREQLRDAQIRLAPVRAEHRIRHPEKGELWLELRATPRREADGGIAWHGVAQDITERRRIQYDLELLDRAIGLSGDAVYLVDDQLRFSYVNEAACTVLGYSREELLTLGPADIDPSIEIGQAREILDNSPVGGVVSFESRHQRCDGTIFPVELNGSHFIHEGRKFGISVVRDISKRRSLEQALVRSEREFRSLAANIPDHIARWDAQGRYLYVNPVHERLLGASVADLIGTTIPDTHSLVKAAVARVAATGEAVMAVRQEVLIDGALQLHDVSVVPEFDQEGKLVGVLGIGRDMTEVYELQEAVVARERQYRSLAEHSPDPIFRYDREGRRIYVNPAVERIIGARARSMLGNIPEAGDILSDDDARRVRAAIRRVFQSKISERVEVSFLDREGHERMHETLLVPEFNGSGEVETVLGMSRDISAIRENEQRLLRFIAALPGFAYSFRRSRDGKYSFPFASPGLTRLFGLQPAEIRRDAGPLHALAHADDRPRIEAVIEEMAQSLASIPFSFRVCRPGASERWYECYAVPEREPDGSTLWHGIMLDVTERILVQRQFELVNQAINQSTDAVYLIGEEGRFVYVNDTACRMLGYARKELLGMSPRDIDPAASAEQIKAIKAAVINGGRIVFETRHRTRDGREIPVEISSSAAVHGDTSVRLAVVRDITERKQAEAALTEREREFRSLAGNIPDNIARWDLQGRYTYINPAHEQTLGRSAEEVLGKTITEVCGGIIEGGGTGIDAVIAANGPVLISRVPVPGSNGEMRLHDLNLVPEFDADDRIVSILGIGRDMTDIYRMQEAIAAREQEFRSLAESSPDYIVRYDREGRTLYLNTTLVRLLGLGSADEVIGKRPSENWPDGRFEAVERAAERAVETGDRQVIELFGPNEQGGTGYSHIFIVPERDLDGRIIGTIAFGRDITELKQAEAQLAKERATLSSFFGALPALAWMKDTEGRYLACNAVHESFLGAPEAEVLGKTDFDFVDAELAAFFRQKDREAAAAGRPCVNEEWVTFASDGRRALLETVKSPVFDAEGKVIGVIGVAHDITERQHMARQIAEREREFRTLVENMTDVVVRYDRQCRRLFVSAAYARVNGLSIDTVLGKRPVELWGRPTMPPEEFEARLCAIMESGRSGELVLEWWEQGRHYCQLLSLIPEFGVNGEVASVLTVARDVSELKRTEALLHAREEAFRSLAENSPDTIARYDRELRRVYASPALLRLSGLPAEALLGKTPAEYPGGESGRMYTEHMRQVLASGQDGEFELHWCSHDGTERCTHVRIVPERDREGRITSLLAIGRDISEVDQYRRRIYNLAFYDPMTGLANRTLFNDRLFQTLIDAEQYGQVAGLMLVDLDHFKNINDSLGHAVGDELLREVGLRLVRTMRSYDTVARIGGDEYGVLLPKIRSAADSESIADKVLRAMAPPFVLEGRELFVSASVGVALFPEHGMTGEELFKYADSAMYHAKARGRNTFQFYQPEMTARADERLELEGALRKALANGELSLHYQPQVTLDGLQLIGAEALLRWQHPQRGNIPPDRFIGIAEETGMIVEIGAWVLREACRTAAAWNAAGMPMRVAVNLSTRQFRTKELVQTVLSSLEQTGCRPQWLELEITESLLLEENVEARETMEVLREAGLSFAIDDFGTGYSALGYLRRFPIETVKIDRSFINGITSDPHAADLVRAIITLCEVLQLKMVAEGVETREQCELLQQWGGGEQMVQGWLIGRPMPREEFESKMLGMTGGSALEAKPAAPRSPECIR